MISSQWSLPRDTNLGPGLGVAHQHGEALQDADQDVRVGEGQVLHQGRDGPLRQDAAADHLHLRHVGERGGRVGQQLGTDHLEVLHQDLVASCFEDFSWKRQ